MGEDPVGTASTTSAETDPPARGPEPTHVLVVDDDDIGRYSLVHPLQLAGFQVAEAATGRGRPAAGHRAAAGRGGARHQPPGHGRPRRVPAAEGEPGLRGDPHRPGLLHLPVGRGLGQRARARGRRLPAPAGPAQRPHRHPEGAAAHAPGRAAARGDAAQHHRRLHRARRRVALRGPEPARGGDPRRDARQGPGRVAWEGYDTVSHEIRAQYERARAANRPVHFEARSEVLDRWFEFHAYPRPGRLDVYLRDITERKRTGQELARVLRPRARAARGRPRRRAGPRTSSWPCSPTSCAPR